jgi:hypothetical protein
MGEMNILFLGFLYTTFTKCSIVIKCLHGGIKVKKTTKCIIEKFPNLEEKIVAYKSVLLSEESLQSLDQIDRNFIRLACFFENPDQANFDLSSLYKDLDNDWLDWALELITMFFREDTDLIQKPSFSTIK